MRVLSVSVGRSAANLVRVRRFFDGGKLRKGLNHRYAMSSVRQSLIIVVDTVSPSSNAVGSR